MDGDADPAAATTLAQLPATAKQPELQQQKFIKHQPTPSPIQGLLIVSVQLAELDRNRSDPIAVAPRPAAAGPGLGQGQNLIDELAEAIGAHALG